MLKKLGLLVALMHLPVGATAAIVLNSSEWHYADGARFTVTYDGVTQYGEGTHNLSWYDVGDEITSAETWSSLPPYFIYWDDFVVAFHVSDSDVVTFLGWQALGFAPDARVEFIDDRSLSYCDGKGYECGEATLSESTLVASNIDYDVVSSVPLPASAWLFGSALLGLGVIKRRKA